MSAGENKSVLTPRQISENGWSALAECSHCRHQRSALGSWKKAAPDRNLVEALENGKLRCFKCHRPSQRILVGKQWPDAGFQRIMTIRIGAVIEHHDEAPKYPKLRKPVLG